ncbi:antA/AntB antirepressor family protein [Vibrio parahaemolyticus]|nr:antA/AntB antirepressor family protein [Vibrio parahaemolyticus]
MTKLTTPANISKKQLHNIVPEHQVDAVWKLIKKYRTKLPCINEHGAFAEGFLIDARQLHKQLEIETPAQIWFPRLVKKYGLEEGKDFCTKMYKSTGGRPEKTWELTVDIAKHVCMVTNNKNGELARRYFVLMEKLFHRLVPWNYQRVQEKKTHPELWKIACEMRNMWGNTPQNHVSTCYRIINEHFFGEGTYRSDRDHLKTIQHERFVPVLHSFIHTWNQTKSMDMLHMMFPVKH